jgi:hypothetical protein
MKYSIGTVVRYKEADLKFEIIQVTPIAYKLLYINEHNNIKRVTPELYPHHFIESDEFELSLKTLLKQL